MKSAKKAVGSHYETLGITTTATDEEIKRAYFGMVRKYQPDRFPEEFKKVRAAYETLSNHEERAEYDKISNIPASVAPLFHEAQQEERRGRDSKAIALYQKMLKRCPELDVIRERCAYAFEESGKRGKAAEVWEELCARHPDNAEYARNLGGCYLDIGWGKKAYAEMQRSLTLDRNSLDGWELFIACSVTNVKDAESLNKMKDVFATVLEAVKPIKTDEWKKIRIYTEAFATLGFGNIDVSTGYLREITRLIRENGREGQREGQTAIREILKTIPVEVLGRFYPELKAIAGVLPDSADEPFMDTLDEVRLSYEIENLKQKGFDELFTELFKMLLTEFPQDDDEIETIAIEYVLLRDRHIYIPQIKRLKTAFPELYALHDSFFNEVLRTRDPEKLMYQRSKKVLKLKRESGDFDDEYVSESIPVRRDQPKVGRNDPCPCGSGKKYKKCCGA